MADPTASAKREKAGPENVSASESPEAPLRLAEAGPGVPLRASIPAGASIYSPSDTPDDSLNPRSCVTCRRRKVKCDKLQPCTNCRRARIPCIFPAPGRAPRRPRPRDPNAPPAPKQQSSEREIELMKRLRKLEGIVEELSGQIELESTRQNSGSESPEVAAHDGRAGSTAGAGSGRTSLDAGSSSRLLGRGRVSSDPSQPPPFRGSNNGGSAASVTPNNASLARQESTSERGVGNINRKFGRLVIHDKGRPRYISSGFWSKIDDEMNELHTATEEWLGGESELSEFEDDTPEYFHEIPGGYPNNAFLFGYHTTEVDLRSLHPLPSQIPFIWQVFDQNVNSITKILHSPSVAAAVNQARNNLDSLEPPLEALMFAIYMGAIVSMEEEEVQTNFGSDQALLTAKYRYALEIALAKAEFLISTDLTTFQAFLLYITLVRRRSDTRYAWTLVGLAVRISHALGLHRDPTNFPGISPFDSEMRRRAFWYLVSVDFRAAEDQGTDLVVDRSFDTQLPLNINDTDFGPDCSELPPPCQDQTDMVFVLMLYNIQAYIRRILQMTSASAVLCPGDVDSSFERQEQLLGDIIKTVDRVCPRSEGSAKENPLKFLAATVGRVIHAKMTILVYQHDVAAACSSTATDQLTEERRDRLYTAAIEVFEHGNLLALDPRVTQWRWMLRVFMQWQAAAYLMLRMSGSPWSPMSERAWTALGVTFSSASAAAELDRIADNAAVWLPFRRLYTRARRHRAAEVARLRADKNAARELDLLYYPKTLPSKSSFNTLSNSVKTALARQVWCKLVDAPPLEDHLLAQMSAPHLWQQGQEAAPCAGRSQAPSSAVPQAMPQAAAQGAPPAQDVEGGAVPGSAPVPDNFTVDMLDFVDQVMALPTFAPADFWPLAYPPNGTNPPPNNSTLAPGQPNNAAQQPTMAHPQMRTQAAVSDASVIAAFRRNNTPPWLYPFSDDASSLTGSGRNATEPNASSCFPPTTTAAAQRRDGSLVDLTGTTPSISTDQPGGPALDDFDMNMDGDDFNWQTFNDSIRGFQPGVGGSTTGLWGI